VLRIRVKTYRDIPSTTQGSAVYVYLGTLLVGKDIGECVFNLDGRQVGDFGFGDEDIHLAFRNTSMPDGPHLLTIYPKMIDTFIQLDYVVYT
jgi:hypothetical protein